jgi:ABC-type phosphate/phosphonate transport system substrate-binding protein
LDDLKGRSVVFEDPRSLTGYTIPKAEMILRGLRVLPLKETGDPEVVRSDFAWYTINQAFWVIQKKADAGAFSANAWRRLSPRVKRDLKIIHQTKPVPRHIVSFSPALEPALSNYLSAVLAEMDQSRQGRRILTKASRIEAIDLLSGTNYESLEYARQLTLALER